MAAVCSPWRSAPRGSTCVVIPMYPYLGEVIIEMSSMREEGLVCLSLCVCGSEVSWPYSVSGSPNLDIGPSGAPNTKQDVYIYVFTFFRQFCILLSFCQSPQYHSFSFVPYSHLSLFQPSLQPSLISFVSPELCFRTLIRRSSPHQPNPQFHSHNR